jgi:hypothetical protein
MNFIIIALLTGLGWLIGLATPQPLIGVLIGLVLGALVTRAGNEPLDTEVMKLVKARTNSYLTEVWAVLPAIKRIEAINADYAIQNLREIFALHFPQELQDEIVTSEEIFDLAKIIIVTEVKPLEQMKAFKRANKSGLFGKKKLDAVHTVLHAGRVYARAGATPAMMQWPEAWALDMGVPADILYRGYLAEIHDQDSSENQRLVTGQAAIDERLDQIPAALGDRAQSTTHNLVSRNTLYAEYRKGLNRFIERMAA